MDYTMFKNRHTSLHHYSTLNMLKWNATVSKWLNSKPKEEEKKLLLEEKKLLSKDRKLGPRIGKQNKQQGLIVLQHMERKRQKEKEIQQRRIDKLRKQKETIIDIKGGGSCQKPDDHISLLKKIERKTDTLKAVKAQVDFFVIIPKDLQILPQLQKK